MSDVPSTLATRRQRRRAIGAALSGALAGCPLCAGRGRYPTAWNTLRDCPGCDGDGLVPADRAGIGTAPCPRCGGMGGEAGGTAACGACRGFGVVVVASADPRRDAA